MLTDGSLATLANLKNNLSINNVEVEEAQQANSDLNTHSSTRVRVAISFPYCTVVVSNSWYSHLF